MGGHFSTNLEHLGHIELCWQSLVRFHVLVSLNLSQVLQVYDEGIGILARVIKDECTFEKPS